ncbi:hypothetical protein HY839_00145 [Candidatus Azambacteria bacterium]|nr:hypothetical protein [Candidatus Azambacteria bacterium]
MPYNTIINGARATVVGHPVLEKKSAVLSPVLENIVAVQKNKKDPGDIITGVFVESMSWF